MELSFVVFENSLNLRISSQCQDLQRIAGCPISKFSDIGQPIGLFIVEVEAAFALPGFATAAVAEEP